MRPSPSEIVTLVCGHLGVERALTCSASQLQGPLRARRACVYILRHYRGCSWGEIARALAMKKRSTVARMWRYAAANPDPEIRVLIGAIQ